MDHCVLSAEMLVKRFGAVTVADNLSVTLDHAEALGVIGPNGAGKSSFFNLLSGNIRADSGRILLEGRDVTHASPNERAIAGIGRTYQIPRPFSQLTVFENLLVGAFFGARLDARRAQQHCYETLALTGLLRHADKPAAALSLLERKRLELARALATRPKVLLLDEIAGGLTEGEAAELVATIQCIHAQGTAIIWIEHVVHALLAVVSRLMVLSFGKKLMEGEPSAVMNSAAVRDVYLGIEVESHA
ncbi:ABC transporter ATP-binding protein [Cupriavidus basilensis]|uniref:ABC transporter ATP-binding protein n=1 Tax=Cupriavidus basilensis TaxID=68895 RepID=A0A0C4YUJ1_9BURK|nr:ABC transporter ATP-binding protein [Cupriavidus basilensis]AJG24266.1 ABC transporter ATP-binding protein [Cupriavidus basilensis]